MADIGKLTVVVLWEPELRAAADALDRLSAALHSKDTATADTLLKPALEACYTAIGVIAKQPDAQLVVCSGDRLRFVPRVTNVVQAPAAEAAAGGKK